MTEIEKDKAFYNNLSGGVTFSGGECMLQLNFLKALLKRCHEAGIHTAVDTAGNVAWESFEEIIPYTDAFLYDVKCFTDKLHQQGTGVSNKKILDNLKKLSKTFKGDIFIRIPIIPGFNTDEAELLKMATFLKDISCKKTELLPYHKLGANKYAALARQVVAEGSVLLKNDKQVLPLTKGCKVASFGRNQLNYFKSGTGSGGMVNTSYVVSILDAL